jgi:hypothetical protein
MLPLQFFGQNLHFALNLFFSLATFATFWLYFDAWLIAKKRKEIFKWLGFLTISVSFLLQGVVVEREVLGQSFFGQYSEYSSLAFRLLGYSLVIIALLIEPLQTVPKNPGLKLNKENQAKLGLTNIFPGVFKFLLPVGAFAIAFLYFRKATSGLERHLKTVAIAFASLGISEIFSALSVFKESNNINIANLVSPFGAAWALEQVFLLVATIMLGKWVWSYLVKRLQSQLFIIFTSSVLLIFLIVSVSFTFLLVRNIENQALSNLETASKVLNYSLESKKAELASVAEVFTLNPEIANAVVAKDHNKLVTLVENSLENKKTSSVIITTSTGMVVARAEDPDNWGDSLSSDLLVQKAVSGKKETSLTTRTATLAPELLLVSAQPIIKDNAVVGTVLVASAISNNFLDGIKSSTGLDSAVYAGNIRAATTLLAPDQKSRWIGVKEENAEVKNKVLEKGETFKGRLSLINQPFLAVYHPLKDTNNQTIGMIFTGQSEVSILKDSGRSIELTFLLASVLLLLSIIPAYLVSKYITYQLS